MTRNEMEIRLNAYLTSYTPDELQLLLRILDPQVRKHVLKEKPIGAKTDLVELPREISADVMAALATMYPKMHLEWTDGRTPLEHGIDSALQRMTGGGYHV